MHSHEQIGKSYTRRVTARIVPFLVLCYLAAYLDRVNVGFAAPSMSRDLHLSASTYGFGAGIFFISYFLFEVPSNLLLSRFGARLWIARIMFFWGILSALMAVVTGPMSFYTIRFLLGLAEAGFFPGVIYYLTLWFPAAQRARVMSLFILAIPLSSILGAPISGLILQCEGLGHLHGWQWLFLAEAAPAVALAGLVLIILRDGPEAASWLPAEEHAWLRFQLNSEAESKAPHHKQGGLLHALLDIKILLLAVVYFGATSCLYALSFYLPSIVAGFGVSGPRAGLIIAIPYLTGMIGMIVWSRHSDRRAERRGHAAIALLIAAGGILAGALLRDPTARMISFAIAGTGTFASLPILWTLPSSMTSGVAMAGGIAIINSIGNLSGFAGTYAIGWLKDKTGSYASGLEVIASFAMLSALIVAFLPVREAATLQSQTNETLVPDLRPK